MPRKVFKGIEKYCEQNAQLFDYAAFVQVRQFLQLASSSSDRALEFPATLHGLSRERLHRIAERFRLLHLSVGKAKTRRMRFARNLEVDYEAEHLLATLHSEIEKLESAILESKDATDYVAKLDEQEERKEAARAKQAETRAKAREEESKTRLPESEEITPSWPPEE